MSDSFFQQAPVPGGAVYTFSASRESFSPLRDRLEGMFEQWDVPIKIRRKLLVAVDEILTNIAEYAYPVDVPERRTIQLRVELDKAENMLSLIFSDAGIPFDPLSVPEPRQDQSPLERPGGGWGIFLVKKSMDQLQYRREKDRNILMIRKSVSPENEPESENEPGTVSPD